MKLEKVVNVINVNVIYVVMNYLKGPRIWLMQNLNNLKGNLKINKKKITTWLMVMVQSRKFL